MRNTETPSTTTDPPRVTVWLVRERVTTAANAASSTSAVIQTWMPCRLRRGAKASTSTPTRAPATTMSIGAIAA